MKERAAVNDGALTADGPYDPSSVTGKPPGRESTCRAVGIPSVCDQRCSTLRSLPDSSRASFCYSMYLQFIQTIGTVEGNNHLNAFPIKGLQAVNDVVLAMPKGKILPSYGKGLVRQLRSICKEFEKG